MYSKMINDGYYRTRVVYDKPLKYCPNGSAGVVISNDGTIHLVSYTTRVISLTSDGWMNCSGTYSATTRKHIGAFMKEYGNGLTYYTAKELAETGNQMNIYTGEIKGA